ncbi:MAG TPA: SOS response-associated peptidase family protein [Kofleriaceae bacterium]|nr:SOS response-associated peptidase family protein [Kofleriaceae bacterium]
MRGELHYTLTNVDGAITAVGAARACDLAPRFNIAPGQHAPVTIVSDGTRVIELMRWGLLPRWRGHGGKRGPLVNAAPLEAVAGTPLLRDAFKKQRVLVLADGCYAWRELKQPVCFHPEPRTVIAFAGIWNINDDDGIASFALLLGPPLVTRVNDAMPIVVPPTAFEAWLDPTVSPDAATDLLAAAEHPTGWPTDTVTTRMASAQYDDAQCIAPLGNPNQGELF